MKTETQERPKARRGRPTTEKTEPLPIGEEEGGTQRSVDESAQVLKSPPDPHVVEKARAYGEALDAVDACKEAAEAAGAELESAFSKTEGEKRVRIVTDVRAHVFWMEEADGPKLKAKKESAVK